MIGNSAPSLGYNFLVYLIFSLIQALTEVLGDAFCGAIAQAAAIQPDPLDGVANCPTWDYTFAKPGARVRLPGQHCFVFAVLIFPISLLESPELSSGLWPNAQDVKH